MTTTGEPYIGKVTDFITRRKPGGPQLALFRHPHAGVQIPAGTVEEGETWEAAALREAFEETGLQNLRLVGEIGRLDWQIPAGTLGVRQTCTVYSRPDPGSFDWARLPRGCGLVDLQREENGYSLVIYREMDDSENPQYVTYQITGWVESTALSPLVRRAFFHLAWDGIHGPEEWEVCTDNHVFRVFWADLADLPEIVPFQKEWLGDLERVFHYSLK